MGMIRLTKIILLSLLWVAVPAGWAGNSFEHAWSVQEVGGELKMLSKTPTPEPFPMAGGPSAVMYFDSAELKPGETLDQIVQGEIEDIKATLSIAEYLEEDHSAVEGIASYVQTIDGVKVAFIKYRSLGDKDTPTALPFTTRHAIFIKQKKIYYVHLFVFFASDQDNIRGDQLRLIKMLMAGNTDFKNRVEKSTQKSP